jgi:2-polyprenyl-3-methyl-5-hydroxy-6-metoxy-1,4-benzoquinol methylase
MKEMKMTVRAKYEDWHSSLEIDQEANAPWHQLVKEFIQNGNFVNQKNVLEIACGRGGFSCWFAQNFTGSNLTAADFSQTAISMGKIFAQENDLKIDWEVCDIQNLSHASESFDAVISCETIEHVPEPKKALAELARVLKRGGKLILTCPNYLGSTGLYRIYLKLLGREYLEAGQPINHFLLLPILLRWLKEAGLNVKKVEGAGHYLPFPGRPPIRIHFLDHLRLLRWFGLHTLIVAEKPLPGT